SAALTPLTDTSAPATNSAAAVTPSSNATTSRPPDGVLLSNQQSVPANSSTPSTTTPANTTPANTPTNVAQATVPPSASSSANSRPVQIAQNMPRSSNSGSPTVAPQR